MTQPIVTDLVLLGGGHSHAIALKQLGLHPLPGVRITLISDPPHTPYSGMLPGHIAGFYTYDETHIDLQRLTRFAQAQFYCDRVLNLDLTQNQVICANHPPIPFDYLSLDIGSTPATQTVSGATQHTIPAKPVSQFLQAWNTLLQNVQNNPQKPWHIAIIGGGAGGVELALNAKTRLQQLLPPENLQISLFHRNSTLLKGHNNWVSSYLTQHLKQRGIQLHLNETVNQVTKTQIHCQSGLTKTFDCAFWVTQASAPQWLAESDLTTDKNGFILVADTLQSVSHPHIFAAGDIATMTNHPRPKAGVFAVRQGQPLFKNISRIVTGKDPKPFKPQKKYLALIGTGDQRAVASWWKLGAASPLLWRWKDKIDRNFMAQFEQLSPTPHPIQPEPKTSEKKPKSNSPNSLFSQVIKTIDNPPLADPLPQTDNSETTPQNHHYLHNFLNDPYKFGQIAVNESFNPLWAIGATPQTVLTSIILPYSSPSPLETLLRQVLVGVCHQLQATHTTLLGGHSTQGENLALSVLCHSKIVGEHSLEKPRLQAGQSLILTQALGTGTLFTADRHAQAKGRWVHQALDSLLLPQQQAMHILQEAGATACTAIQEKGLLGHLLMLRGETPVQIELMLSNLPIFDGAIDTLAQGFTHPHQLRNQRYGQQIVNWSDCQTTPSAPLLFDPQVAGGLLAALPSENAESCLIRLQTAGYTHSRIVGHLSPPVSGQLVFLR
ncbi:selenide, water dikinase SelD [Spirulina sp. CS-785/01]|uniref:selenide, water dikinase SelD n=1 Tax=Spirulina sp. CS-785/01 TaxID=3021716 RepID=UPI0023304651|nr:selenide, water dikinase SelD [Spirulina sp. CS-785/01]MDB9314719.1 selenide, water dikinase SelD [Spirulina sp. CS-785/01]